MSRLPNLEFHIGFERGPEADWQVVGFRVEEALDSDYSAWIDIETEEPHVDIGMLLGATCELTIARGEHAPRMLYGVALRVESLGSNERRHRVRVRACPALSLARQRSNSRIWQDRSVQDIVREVLGVTLDEYGRGVEFGRLQRGVNPRDYCVQYRETDYDFVCRLLAEEGISWFFSHEVERGCELMNLCDDNDDYPGFVNIDGESLLPMITHNPEEADLESVQAFEWARQLTTTKVAMREFDSANPEAIAGEESGGADARGCVRRVYEPEPHRIGGELGRRARDREQCLRVSGSTATCETNASLIGAGRRFTLDGVTQEGTPREWIVTAIEHEYGASEGVPTYRNSFDCVPASTPLRPSARVQGPEIRGPQTATVIGGGEIDVDASGRILVAFHWQEANDPAGASCRVRCAQSWAGPGWGAQFIPRVGMEVVVEFLDGNPDRPLVTGCVYNGANEPPFALPGSSTQSGWRSNSSPGGGGSNELRFEDATGAEEIYVHGQKDWVAEINHDASTTVGHDQRLAVGHDRETSVQHDRRERVGNDQSLAIGANSLETVGANMQLNVVADQSVNIGGGRSLSVARDHSESVGASASESVAVAKTVTVGGALATIVGGAMNTSVGALSSEEVGGLKTVSVGASSSESVVGGKSVDAATISHSARKDLSLSAGAGASVTASKDVSVDAGEDLSIHANKKGQLLLDEELTIKVGKAAITLKKNGEIVLDGTKITVKGKKSITLKSKKIDQN